MSKKSPGMAAAFALLSLVLGGVARCCSQDDLKSTSGIGLFYCFAAD